MDKDTVDQWNEAVEAFQNGQLEESLDIFQAIANTSACLLYNSAVVLQRLQRFEEAIQKLTETIEKDSYFAIALFRRGYIYFLQRKYQQAIEDFESCVLVFRSAKHIDYAQLGQVSLTVTLSLSDVTFNTGVCYFISGNQLNGMNLLHQAQNEADARNRSTINGVLSDLQKPTETFDPQLIPLPDSFSLFRPLRSFSFKPKDFLGTSKVIASRGQGTNSAYSSQEDLHKMEIFRRTSLTPFETKLQIPPPPGVPPPRRPDTVNI